VLKISVGEEIRQLIVSPNGKLLAVVTAHTVQIAILPHSSRLNAGETKAIKPKTFTIGPTTHVTNQSAIASVLWHPLGESGNCLVTITIDAVVRLWEFDRNNRSSSECPALAMDMKRLAVATSEEVNVAPNRLGRNKTFSSDAAGMEVAAACFGGTGSDDESAWSAMTLWLAMKEGDVYALCPLLPSKWQPPPTLIPALSTAVIAKAASLQELRTADSEVVRQCDKQYRLIQELDGQEPVLMQCNEGMSHGVQIYKRPSQPSFIPRLQGPFQILAEDTEDYLELSDIHVIAAKSDFKDLVRDEDDTDAESDFETGDGLSAAVVCLMARSGRVYICLELEGVEGLWLPRKKPKVDRPPQSEPYLVVLEGLDTLKTPNIHETEWPTFTEDVISRYSFFTTHSEGIYYFSLSPWLRTLEDELSNDIPIGTPFRMDIFNNGPGTLRELILPLDQDVGGETKPSISVPASIIFQDSDLGYFLLTTKDSLPYAAVLDEPQNYDGPAPAITLDASNNDYIPDLASLSILSAPRSAYQPPPAFYTPSTVNSILEIHVPARHKRLSTSEIRLSTATLDLMTQAHRVLSRETHGLGVAAADLFRRCERLVDELRDQIGRVAILRERGERVIGDEQGDGGKDEKSELAVGNKNIDQRVDTATEKNKSLVRKYEALRKKFLSEVRGKALSDKEKAWAEEAESLRQGLERSGPDAGEGEEEEDDKGDESESERQHGSEPWQRFQVVILPPPYASLVGHIVCEEY